MLRAAESIAGAVSFDRLLITGLLVVLAAILVLSGTISLYYGSDVKDAITFVLKFYKDMGLMIGGGLIGALASHIRSNEKEESQ